MMVGSEQVHVILACRTTGDGIGNLAHICGPLLAPAAIKSIMRGFRIFYRLIDVQLHHQTDCFALLLGTPIIYRKPKRCFVENKCLASNIGFARFSHTCGISLITRKLFSMGSETVEV